MKNPSPKTKPAAFLLVTGDEFLRRSRIESVLSRLLPAEDRKTRLIKIYPDDFDLSELLSAARTGSLLGGLEVFWISQAERIKTDWAPLEHYLKEPSESSCFIFEADDLPQTYALPKLAKAYGEHLSFKGRGAEEGLNVLREKMKRAGKTLTPEAWRCLQERLAGAPRLMDQCLDQLLLYSDQKVIEEDAVKELAARWLRYEPFDLTDALIKKEGGRALRIFRYFYDLSGEVASVVGLIHWQLRRLWHAKRMLQEGQNAQSIGRTLRISPFQLERFLSQAKRFELKSIEKLIENLWALDAKVKKGAEESEIAVQTFLAAAV